MDYFTRQLILLLTKTVEAFAKQNGAVDQVRKAYERDAKVQKEILEKILAAHNESEGNRGKSEKRQYDVQNSTRWAAWITAIATTGAVIAATWYGCTTRNMWREMQTQTETGQRQLEQSDRAWLGVEISAESPFEFTTDGGARFSVRPHIHNSGKSPATGIVFSAKLILAPMNPNMGNEFFKEAPSQQNELCDKITKTPVVTDKTRSDFQQVIFPNDTNESVTNGLAVSKADIDATKREVAGKSGPEALLAPFIVGCVDYVYATALRHHQTGFIYMLQHHDRTLPPNIFPIRGIRVGHSVKAEDVYFEKWPFGGFYAY